jgi:hypothetical protein
VSAAPKLLRSFVDALDVFRPVLTQPSYAHLMTLMVGWVLTTGKHAVTEALVSTDVARRRHHEVPGVSPFLLARDVGPRRARAVAVHVDVGQDGGRRAGPPRH